MQAVWEPGALEGTAEQQVAGLTWHRERAQRQLLSETDAEMQYIAAYMLAHIEARQRELTQLAIGARVAIPTAHEPHESPPAAMFPVAA